MKLFIVTLMVFFSTKVFADSIRIGLRYSFKTAYSSVDNAVPIKELYSVLKNKNFNKIHIYGHTDWIASDEINQPLSEVRAKSILDLLVKYGINKSKIEVEGFGKKQPVADNTREDGRAQNRRVSLAIPNISRADLDTVKAEIENSTYLYVISVEHDPVKEKPAVVDNTLAQEIKPISEEPKDLTHKSELKETEPSASEDPASEKKMTFKKIIKTDTI